MSNQQIVFDSVLQRIRRDTDTVAQALRGARELVTASDYDLRASEANLREAADKIAELRKVAELRHAS